jgi:predicted nucleic acid-binding protein
MLIGRYTCVLDACVLHPAFLGASLLWFATERMYQPLWSELILDEWQESLEKRFGDNPGPVLAKRKQIEAAFPGAMVVPPQSLIDALDLPDANDRHVLAAAIVGRADAVVTANLKHFPPEICSQYDVEIIHPDTFLVNVIDLDQDRAVKACQKHRAVLKNPPFTQEEFVERFSATGLVQAHQRLLPLTDLL